MGGGNSTYSSTNGVLCNKSQSTLIQCPEGKTGAYTIPDTVTNIGAYAFSSCTGLTGISIGNGVISIGSYAFQYCYGLSEITVSGDNSAYSSTNGVLFNNGQTTLIQCPASKAGSYVMPDSVLTIGDYAFQSCTSLTGVVIGNSVSRIGNYAFYGCDSLGHIALPNSVVNIGGGAFTSCDNLSRVLIPNSVTNI